MDDISTKYERRRRFWRLAAKRLREYWPPSDDAITALEPALERQQIMMQERNWRSDIERREFDIRWAKICGHQPPTGPIFDSDYDRRSIGLYF